MATDKNSNASSDRKKWRKIFNSLVHMLQNQQTQLESLAKERKVLEDRIKIQYERWLSDVHSLQDQIAQMEVKFTMQEKERLVEAAKWDFFTGLKNREASLCKLKLESRDTDLADFKELVDFLAQECLDPNADDQGNSEQVNNENSGKATKAEKLLHAKKLEGEVRKLKRENQKLASRNSAEVSALLAEQKFVWSQYRIMENNYSKKLNSKNFQIGQANRKIDNLLAGMQQLESLNKEKDDTVVKLKTDLAKKETEMKERDEEISRLSKQVELLRKSGSASVVTPVLNRCREKQNTGSLDGNSKGKAVRSCSVKKESHTSAKVAGKRKQSLASDEGNNKRSKGSKTPTSETPRLFTSTFKIPKLKSPSASQEPCD